MGMLWRCEPQRGPGNLSSTSTLTMEVRQRGAKHIFLILLFFSAPILQPPCCGRGCILHPWH